MTNEKRLDLILTMLQEYDLATGNKGAGRVFAHPDRFLDSYNPLYTAAAALLVETRAKMDTATTPRTVSAAVGRIIKNASRDDHKGIFRHKNIFAVCDGFRLLRMRDDITSLPHTESNFNVSAIMNGDLMSSETIQLPSVADLKTYIAEDKVKNRGKIRSPYLLDGVVWCNAAYLIDMIQALPNAVAYRPKTQTSPIYFIAQNGNDGILLPCRPPKEKERS